MFHLLRDRANVKMKRKGPAERLKFAPTVDPVGSTRLILSTKPVGMSFVKKSGAAPFPSLPGFRDTPAGPWSLTSLREKLIKIGAKLVSHGRYVAFQLAEVAVSRQMFAGILMLIHRLRAPPPAQCDRKMPDSIPVAGGADHGLLHNPLIAHCRAFAPSGSLRHHLAARRHAENALLHDERDSGFSSGPQ